MSSKTTNFNLHKIDLIDAPPDITVLNQNWDIIDEQLKNANENIETIQTNSGTAINDFQITQTEDAVRGVRIHTASGTGASIVDQTDLSDDNSDRTGLKIQHDSVSDDEMIQVFRTTDGVTKWYQLYGKHNAFISIRMYSTLNQISLSPGSETIAEIATNLPDNSMLVYPVTTDNAAIYPTNYGLVTVKKTSLARVEFEFTTTAGVSYHGAYSSSNDTFTGWIKTYDSNNIQYGTDDMTAGSSTLSTGNLYFVYE